jgi:DNA primase
MDPDLFIKDKGPKEFIKSLQESKDYLNFMVDYFSKSLDLKSPAAKNELINNLVKRIKDWNHPLMVHESLRKLAKLTNTPENIIGVDQNEVPNILIKKSEKLTFNKIDPNRVIESDFLRFILLVGDSGSRFIKISKLNLTDDHFKTDVCKKLYSKCLLGYQEKENTTLDLLSLAIDLDDTEEQHFLSEILQKKINRERAEEDFIRSIKKILDRKWMEDRENIKIKIQSGKFLDEDLLDLAKEFDIIKNKRPEVIFPDQT